MWVWHTSYRLYAVRLATVRPFHVLLSMSSSTTLLEPEIADGADGVPAARRIQPRASLPSTRAVVGGLLVALAALGTFVAHRAATAAPTTAFVVAAADVAPGERLDPSRLRLEAMALPEGVGAGAFRSPDELDGAVAIAPLRAGELVQASAVLLESAASPPASELSFAVERTRALDGTLNRGERVDVLATYGTGDTAATHVVVADALITDIDNERRDAIGEASTITVILALPSPDDVLEAAHATQVAEITLVRTTKAPDAEATTDVYRGPEPPGGR